MDLTMEEINKPKKKYSKTCSEKYKSDPEFKKKHLDHMKEITACTCGKQVSRSHMNRHLKTKAHLNALNPEIVESKKIKLLENFKKSYEKTKIDNDDEELKNMSDNTIELIDKLIKKIKPNKP